MGGLHSQHSRSTPPYLLTRKGVLIHVYLGGVPPNQFLVVTKMMPLLSEDSNGRGGGGVGMGKRLGVG